MTCDSGRHAQRQDPQGLGPKDARAAAESRIAQPVPQNTEQHSDYETRITRNYAVHIAPPRFTADSLEQIPGSRGPTQDDYLRDYRRLDAASRTRALTLTESLRLEECIRRLDRRAGWRAGKRQKRAART